VQVFVPVTWGAAPGEVGWRWRADLAFAASGGQAVGEELQPERRLVEKEKAAQHCCEAVCSGRYWGDGGRLHCNGAFICNAQEWEYTFRQYIMKSIQAEPGE